MHVCARYIEAVGGGPAVPDEGEEAGVAVWSHLFKAVVALVGGWKSTTGALGEFNNCSP